MGDLASVWDRIIKRALEIPSLPEPLFELKASALRMENHIQTRAWRTPPPEPDRPGVWSLTFDVTHDEVPPSPEMLKHTLPARILATDPFIQCLLSQAAWADRSDSHFFRESDE
jgi:hypothetical protein